MNPRQPLPLGVPSFGPSTVGYGVAPPLQMYSQWYHVNYQQQNIGSNGLNGAKRGDVLPSPMQHLQELTNRRANSGSGAARNNGNSFTQSAYQPLTGVGHPALSALPGDSHMAHQKNYCHPVGAQTAFQMPHGGGSVALATYTGCDKGIGTARTDTMRQATQAKAGNGSRYDRGVKKRKRQQAQEDKGTKGGNKRPTNDCAVKIPSRYLFAQQIGTSSEEVAAWREARRKNYPTTANIQRQAQRLVQKQEVDKNINDDIVGFRNLEEESNVVEQNRSRTIEKNTKPCDSFGQTSCQVSTEQCTNIHDESTRANHQAAMQHRKKNERRRRGANTTECPTSSSSLLKKLLQQDIRKERIVLLQCLRHLLRMKAREQQIATKVQ